MSNPFGQARQLLQLGEDQNLEVGELQALYNSGLQSVLFRAAKEIDLSQVDREAFERALGLDPSVFNVMMGAADTTDDIAAEWRAAKLYVNEHLNQTNFPLTALEVPFMDQIQIVDPGKSFTEAEGLALLAKEGLVRPTYEHALRFAKQHGRTTKGKKPYIIFLHEPWLDPHRNRRVVCVDRDPSSRELNLLYPDYRFSGSCVLAGVRPRT